MNDQQTPSDRPAAVEIGQLLRIGNYEIPSIAGQFTESAPRTRKRNGKDGKGRGRE